MNHEADERERERPWVFPVSPFLHPRPLSHLRVEGVVQASSDQASTELRSVLLRHSTVGNGHCWGFCKYLEVF